MATHLSRLGRPRFTGLWREPDFLRLWVGQTVSLFGSFVTTFSLPVIAALALGAGAFQMALLSAAQIAPGLLLGLVAGVWIDRLPRRPVLIAADLGRAIALASIPLAALLHALRIEYLYIVACLSSVLSVIFDVAYPAYLPSLVGREQLIEGNGKLASSGALAEVAGFGIAGILVQALTAPIAIFIDALSFVFSAASLALIRAAEPLPAPGTSQPGVWRSFSAGARLALAEPILRALAGSGAVHTFFSNALGAIIVLYLARDLHLAPGVMGAIFATGGVSSFIGALFAQRVTRRWRLGRVMLTTLAISSAVFFTPLASGPFPVIVTLLVLAQLTDGAHTIFMVNRLSLIQAITPSHAQGRLHATLAVIEGGAMLAGVFFGGVLGERIGLRPTLFVACGGRMFSVLWLALSPVRTLRGIPPDYRSARRPDHRQRPI